MKVQRIASVSMVVGLTLWLLLGAGAMLRAEEKSFLWKVRSEKNTLYLLGSVHFLKKEHYPLKKVVETAFERSQKLVLEIDLGKTEPQKAQREMLTRGMNTGGATLDKSVSPETLALVEKRARELRIGVQGLNHFKPWLVALTISTLKLQQLGFDPNYGVDRYFFERAKKDEKEISGLESFEYQLNLFDRLSAREQERMLLQTLKDLDLLEKGVDRIIQAWTNGNSEALESLLLGSFKEYPEIYQKIMYDRNRQWLPRIEGFLSQNEITMVVVGAGHLIGRGGLVDLLKERGFAVEQM